MPIYRPNHIEKILSGQAQSSLFFVTISLIRNIKQGKKIINNTRTERKKKVQIDVFFIVN